MKIKNQVGDTEKSSPLSPFLLSYRINIKDCVLKQELEKKLKELF